MSGGFNGPLASKEGVFIALDSIPMVMMSLLLTALHPRWWFVSKYERAAARSSARDPETAMLQAGGRTNGKVHSVGLKQMAY